MSETNGEDREKPDELPDEVWDSLGPAIKRRMPMTTEGLWLQWCEMQLAVHRINDVLEKAELPGKVRANRLSITIKDYSDREYLVIVDGYKGKRKVATFHNGSSPFKAVAMVCWKILNNEVEWKDRQRAARKPDEAGATQFSSGAF